MRTAGVLESSTPILNYKELVKRNDIVSSECFEVFFEVRVYAQLLLSQKP